MVVLNSEGEVWGREGGDKVEAIMVWTRLRKNDTGMGETNGGDDKGWGVCVCLKVRAKCGDERAEIRWKLRLLEKAILV